MEQAQAPVRLGARGLTRRFGDLVAVDAIDLAVARGSVHAIVGGNGAGKTTLMRLLQGIDRPSSGSVLVDGQAVTLDGPADAFRHGIGMVHQEFMLVPGLTLLENLILAREPTNALGRIDRSAALAKADALAREAGVTIDWDRPVESAPIHLRQIVEILRLMYRDADVLILDEPTAVLAPAQVTDLLNLLRRLRDEGRTILFISHKLDEVLAVADRITVLRGGRVVGDVARGDMDRARLADLMIGEPVAVPAVVPRESGRAVLAIEALSARDGRGALRLRGVDLMVRAGEILGVAGVAGNGQDELVACVAGLTPVTAGRIVFGDSDITHETIAQRRRRGLAYLSPDRAAEGLCLSASVADNAIAGHQRTKALSTGLLIRSRAVRAHVDDLLRRFAVVHGSPRDPIGALSGGNQQRVAMARELDGKPSLLLACQPTRGVDIRGIAALHGFLLAFRDAGGAVLLVSEELDEVLTLSDRVVVLYDGVVSGELPRGTAEAANVGRLMLGQRAA